MADEADAKAPATPEVAAPKPALLQPCVDLVTYRIKIDHFDQMHTLGDDVKVEGAPNFRKVSSINNTVRP
jgi:hypothetical protein